MKAYRIVKPRHGEKSDAFSGIGSRDKPGRWNMPGFRMVYCSDSLSLATLETMAHLVSPRSMQSFVWFVLNVPDDLMETPDPIPEGWNVKPDFGNSYNVRMISARFGTKWIQEQRSLVLRVPSAVIPSEYNLLVNPLHPKFDLSMIEGPFPVSWDERLA
jgi:RES domain-containing protein